MHIKTRNIQKYILELLDNFPAVAVLGARQVGKSILLKALLPDANFLIWSATMIFNAFPMTPN